MPFATPPRIVARTFPPKCTSMIALPRDIEEYESYKESVINFVRARNLRIEKSCKTWAKRSEFNPVIRGEQIVRWMNHKWRHHRPKSPLFSDIKQRSDLFPAMPKGPKSHLAKLH